MSKSAEVSAFMQLARARKQQADNALDPQLKRELDALSFLVQQWPSDLLASRAGQAADANAGQPLIPARPALSIDTLRDPIAHVAAEAEQTDLGPELTPADDFGGLVGPIDDTEIELREGLIRRIQRQSSARSARNWAADRARKAGQGYYLVLTRYVNERSMDQEVCVDKLYNQSMVRLDPRHEKTDGSDCDWEFWGADIPWEQYRAEYPHRASKAGAGSDDEEWRGLGDEAPDWFTSTTTADGAETRSVRVENYCYTKRESVDLVQLADGRCVPEKDVTDQMPLAVGPDGKPITRTEVVKTIWWAKIDGVNLLDETEWPSPHMPIVKVVWEEIQPYDKERRFQGMVQPARDPAFGVSVMATTEVEVAMMAPKTPVVGYAGQFEGFEAAWDQANVRNIGRLEVNARTDQTPPGTLLPHPQRLNVGTEVGVWDGLREMFVRAVKSTTGVPDATLGNVDPSVRSGRGIRLLQEQARQGTSGGLAHLVESVTQEARIVNSLLYPIYGIRPGRLLQMMTGKHESQSVIVGSTTDPRPFVRNDKGRPQPFDATQHQGQTPDRYQLTPDAEFNVAIRVSKDYDTRRQEEASTLGDLIQSDPALLTWFGDLFFENQDGPGHKDMAERAKLMLNPAIQQKLAGGQGGIPPHVQAMVTQLQQQNQQLQQAVQTDQVKVQGSIEEAKVRGSVELQRANLEIASKERMAALDRETKLSVAELGAKVDRLALFLEERGRVGAQIGDQQQAAQDRAHEVGMAAMAHQHSLEQGQQAAAVGQAQQQQSTDAVTASQAAQMSHEQQMAEQAAQQQPQGSAE